MKETIQKIYTGAFNNIEYSRRTKDTMLYSGGILLIGIFGSIYFLTKKK